MPGHDAYVEPCGGSAAVLLRKPRSKLETYNDIDSGVVNLFRVLRDHGPELARLIRLTPWARQEYELARANSDDPIEAARRFLIRSWMSIEGQASSEHRTWRATRQVHGRGTVAAADFTALVDTIHRTSQRLAGVQIEQLHALEAIMRYDSKDTVIYFDPPYVSKTRRHRQVYLHEVNGDFHKEAAEALCKAKGMAIVSGYSSPEYVEYYEANGWQRRDREMPTNGGGKRLESIWLSPKTVRALGRPQQIRLF